MRYPGGMLARSRLRLALVVVLVTGAAGVFAACGEDDVSIPPGASGAPDGAPSGEGGGGGGDDAAIGADGGSDVVVDSGKPCAPPTDPTKAALCIDLIPETMKFEAASDFDGRGVLFVGAYGTAQPDNDAGGVAPLSSVSIPSADGGVDGGAEADLRSLPEIRFDALDRDKVFVRAGFVDGAVRAQPEAGWWFGGVDLSKGVKANLPIQGIDVKRGAGTRVAMPLTALRRLVVTVTRVVAPVGNAQGPLSIAVVDKDTVGASADLFGAATSDCANLSAPGASVKVPGFVVGKGPYFLLPVLDDYGVGTPLPAGGLTSLDTSGATPKVPAANKVTFAADAYGVAHSVSLTTAVPRAAGPPDALTCP